MASTESAELSESAGDAKSAQSAQRLGFVGLGIMGRGMASNLCRAGHDVTVYNRTAERTKPLAELGAKVAPSPAELATACDIIFICVSDTPDVEQVLFGDNGLAEGLHDGSLVVDHSTVSPIHTRGWAKQLADKGVAYVDAPVSGGSEGAANGTLSVMAGGDEDALERARPYLKAVGSTITHVGPVGTGQLCKLVNQVLVVVSMLGVAEGLVLAQAGGLDPAVAVAATKGGAGGSWMLANRGPQVAVRDFRPGFTIDLQQKDLRLVLEAADELGVPAIATSIIHQLYRTLQAEGLGGEGNHGLVKAIEKLAGLTVHSDADSA